MSRGSTGESTTGEAKVGTHANLATSDMAVSRCSAAESTTGDPKMGKTLTPSFSFYDSTEWWFLPKMGRDTVVEHPGWGDVRNLIESAFMSNRNLGQFQGTQWSRENPGTLWRNLVEEPHGGTSWNIQMEG